MEIAWHKIIGHTRAIARLRTLLREGRLPHALLFTGPEGVGKLRVARALAASLLCLGEGELPCGRCASCRALRAEDGAHPDFLELHPEGKAIQTIRIDAIRQMQTTAARRPTLSRRRVVIIDDAQCMNEAAENGLLKTLEEPSGAVTFILVTSAKTALLDTIISRCMTVGFGMLPEAQLAAALEARGISAQDAARLASLSDGSFSRALALEADDGLTLRDDTLAFLRERARFTPARVFERGAAMGEWPRERLSEWFLCVHTLLRDLLVLYGNGASPLLYHKDLRQALAALLPEYSEQRVFALVALTEEAQHRLLSNVNTRLLVEGFFLRCMEQ